MSRLAVRYIRWVVAVSFFVTLSGIALVSYLEYQHDLERMEDQVTGLETFLPTLATSVWRLDDTQIDLQLQGIVQLPAVRSAAVLLDDGELYAFAGTFARDADEPPAATFPLIYTTAGTTHDLGELAIHSDESAVMARLPVRLLELSAIQMIRGVVVAIVILWIFQKLVGRRLNRLIHDIRGLNWDNLQRQPMPDEDDASDEISEVRNTLELMRIKILQGMRREEEVEDELNFRRLFDAATGLPNRTLLRERMRVLAQAHCGRTLVVIGVELLHLSELDSPRESARLQSALKELADKLCNLVGADGIVARYSEHRLLLVMLGDETEDAGIEHHLARLDSLFARPLGEPLGHELYLPIAYGATSVIVSAVGHIRSGRAVAQALQALDASVSRGRSGARTVWDETLQEHEQMSFQRIRSALEQQAFDLYGQPILDLRTNAVTTVECLLRWRDDDLKTLGTEATIRALENFGATRSLDQSVLRKALAIFDRVKSDYEGNVSVNITARSFSDPEFFTYIQTLPDGFLARLELELTETNVIHDINAAQKSAAYLSRRGATIVLDDFGTGFSSLEYLSQFDFGSIKIDRSFLAPGVRNQKRLLEAMVSIAHGVGSKVVAEGIEAQWQLDLCRRLEVDHVQGYALCEPMATDQLHEYLRNRSRISA